MADAGLEIREDGMGNIFGRWVGSEPHLPAVGSGSHTDAIPQERRYDGTLGVLGPIEAIAALRRAGFTPRRSIEALMFTSEEPTRFGISCVGSRAMAAKLDPEYLAGLSDVLTENGTFLDAAKAAGYVLSAGDRGYGTRRAPCVGAPTLRFSNCTSNKAPSSSGRASTSASSPRSPPPPRSGARSRATGERGRRS